MKSLLKYRPQKFYEWICLFFGLILIFSSWSAYKNLRANLDEPIPITAQNLHGFQNISLVSDPDQPNKLPEIHFIENRGNAKLKIILPKVVRTGVLEIKIDPSAELWKNYIYVRATTLQSKEYGHPLKSLNIKSNNWLPLRPTNHTYRIPLYRDFSKNIVVLEFKYPDLLPSIPINEITVRPASFFDYPAANLLLCLAVIVITFLPGIIISLIIPKSNLLPLPLNSFLISLVLNLVSLAICKIFNINIFIGPLLVVAAIWPSIVINKKRQQLRVNALAVWKKNIPDLNVLICILALISLAMSFGYPSPGHNIHHGHITSEHTFGTFTAHDSIFQFANGKSVLSGDFEEYYGTASDKKLLFLPQDREILPGLSYAATEIALEYLVGSSASKQYFPYGVYYLICHGLLLCMLFSWTKSYSLRVAYGATFFISTTPVFWTLAMVGWFKLTGAAMILAGLFIVRKKPHLYSSWIWAGLLFGLGKNYHGGSALVLPVLTLWMLLVTYKTVAGIRLTKLFGMFVSVTAFTCLVIFPWNWYVKNIWNVGSHKLFSMHFLNGNFVEESLLDSVAKFFNKTPWPEQLETRFDRVLGIFDFERLLAVLASYDLHGYGLTQAWLRFSSSWFIVGILPYVVLAGAMILVIKSSVTTKDFKPVPVDIWFKQFGGMCFVNTLFLAFISYGPADGSSDITWHLPSLIIFGVLLHIVFSSVKAHRPSYIVWVCVGFFQLALLTIYG